MRRKSGSRGQTTCYVIAYDIPDDRRRTKVHEILLGFGKWTQYSLFECFLSRKDVILLQSKLGEYLIEAQDSVRFYPSKLSREGRSSDFSECRPSRHSNSDWKPKPVK